MLVHPKAIVEEGAEIGEGTRVWAFAHVLQGARIGRDCNICDGVFVESDVYLGDRVTVKCGVQLWDGIRLEDDVFVGPNATFANDKFPRSRSRPERFLETTVRAGASIGANATILPGIEIGRGAMVGAGAVVTRSVPPNAVVAGNPARIVSYAGTHQLVEVRSQPLSRLEAETGVRGVTIHSLPEFVDLRGRLTAAEVGKNLPFEPKRFFVVYGVGSPEVRGEHAHRTLHQFLVCLHGECRLLVDDGRARAEVALNSPMLGVHVAPGVWGVQYRFSADAVLLVLASDVYDADDYIRSYDAFMEFVRSGAAGESA